MRWATAVMFQVDVDQTFTRLRGHGAQSVGSDGVQYEDTIRLRYVHRLILVGLAQSV